MRHTWQSMDKVDKRSRVSALASEGKSSSEIAVMLGAPSRNAIIGFCHREKIQLKGRQIGSAAPTRPKADNVVYIKPTRSIKKAPKPSDVPAEVIVLDPPKAQPGKKKRRRISILDMPLFGRCRGPINDDYRWIKDPTKMMFCGEVTEPESSWCKKCQAKYTTGHVKPSKIVDQNGDPIMSKSPKRRAFHSWLR